MSDPAKAAQLWAEALSDPAANTGALAETLADDITTVSALGTTEGKDRVLATFGQSPIAGLFAQGKWSDPVADGDTATATCTFRAGAPVGGVTVTVSLDRTGRISRVESAVLPAAPPEVQPLKLGEEVAAALSGALANGTPVVVAYTDAEGQPHISLRGTVQVFSDNQLAIWIRNPEGGLLRAIPENPKLALFYRDSKTRTSYQFYGRAHAESDPAVRERVYANSPEQERNLDPQQGGVAVVVDVDRLEGRQAGSALVMDRSA